MLNDGRVVEERQPHFRGGVQEPLTRADIEEKFALSVRYGGWDDKRATSALDAAGEVRRWQDRSCLVTGE